MVIHLLVASIGENDDNYMYSTVCIDNKMNSMNRLKKKIIKLPYFISH